VLGHVRMDAREVGFRCVGTGLSELVYGEEGLAVRGRKGAQTATPVAEGQLRDLRRDPEDVRLGGSRRSRLERGRVGEWEVPRCQDHWGGTNLSYAELGQQAEAKTAGFHQMTDEVRVHTVGKPLWGLAGQTSEMLLREQVATVRGEEGAEVVEAGWRQQGAQGFGDPQYPVRAVGRFQGLKGRGVVEA
jgi:hypothetical protein